MANLTVDLPIPNADVDSWGVKINAALGAIRDELNSNKAEASALTALSSTVDGVKAEIILLPTDGQTFVGYSLVREGLTMQRAGVLTTLAVELPSPRVDAETWTVDAWRGSAVVTLASAMVATGAVAVVTTPAAAYLAGDVLYVRQSAGTGGIGAAVRLGLNGATIPVIGSALATPATPTVERYGSSGNRVVWTAPTGAYGVRLYRGSLRLDDVAQATSYLDAAGAAGDTYTLRAFTPKVVSAPSTAAAVSAWTGPAQVNGAPVGWGPQVFGTTPTTAVAPTDTVAGNEWHLQSGNAGGDTANDAVARQFTDWPGTARVWGFSLEYAMDGSNDRLQVYVAANALVTGHTFTTGVQVETDPTGTRLGGKSTAVNGDSGTAGSFKTLQAKTAGSAAINANGTNFYGLKITITDNGNGTYALKLFQGTTAQLAAGTLPQVGSTVTLDASFVSGWPAGYLWVRQLGKALAGTEVEGSRIRNFRITHG